MKIGHKFTKILTWVSRAQIIARVENVGANACKKGSYIIKYTCMAVKTSNFYGKLVITDDAIAMTAYHAALDCYGVIDLVSRSLTDSLSELFAKNTTSRGVKVITLGNRINLELFVILKEGVNVNAISEAIQGSVRYNVETYTGMRVNKVIVNIVGVKV